MLGVAFGDIVGAFFEHRLNKLVVFSLFSTYSRFTDDTVLAVAVADSILRGTDFGQTIRVWGRRYPDAGYGGTFIRWLIDEDAGDYGSWGNGSAMRVAAVGWAFSTVDEVLKEARLSAMPTHSHDEGIKGAQAVALAVFRARTGATKEVIRNELEARFGYKLATTVDEIRPYYRFDVSCQGSVPEALVAFFDSHSVESAVRLAVSLGGDSDTQAAIAGAVAEAYYGGLPPGIEVSVRKRLDGAIGAVLDDFYRKYVYPARTAHAVRIHRGV